MIPNADEAKKLWDTYHLPPQKRIHVTHVAELAVFLAGKINKPVNIHVLQVAALLHDIDKAAPKLHGEQHPDTAVRILREEGMGEVADVVATHSLYSILSARPPTTWEQKLLYLADKMVKYDIVGVDERFNLWNAEHLPPDAQKILDESYPLVKKLEQEVFNLAQISPDDILTGKGELL